MNFKKQNTILVSHLEIILKLFRTNLMNILLILSFIFTLASHCGPEAIITCFFCHLLAGNSKPRSFYPYFFFCFCPLLLTLQLLPLACRQLEASHLCSQPRKGQRRPEQLGKQKQKKVKRKKDQNKEGKS
jgi:hypothetical protein